MSNASETNGAVAALTEQSNGTFPFGNSQNVDHPTGYGNASQWQWSNEESDYPNSENRQAWNSEIPDEIIFNDKDGKLTRVMLKDGNSDVSEKLPQFLTQFLIPVSHPSFSPQFLTPVSDPSF